MHTSLFLTAIALIPLATAAPPRRPPFYYPRDGANSTTSTLPTATAAVPIETPAVPVEPSVPSDPTAPTCDLAGIQQPASDLPPPTTDMNLILIALGQGTQNYTCSNTTAKPAPIGAVAQLFNASCAFSSNPTADTTALGSIEESASIGAHFFVDNTTPDFNIFGLGNTQAKKIDDCDAPDATANVKWLQLQAQEQGTDSGVKMIYRLNTVGGLAPATCEGVGAGEVVTVEYEAQYWVYA